MRISYWIQHADFASEDHDPVDVSEAIRVVENHDWISELQKRSQLEESGEEWCDPGIGFVADEGLILHLCPVSADRWYFYYHYAAKQKLLGFIPWSTHLSRRKTDVPSVSIRDAITHFFGSDHDWLLSNTDA
jgi:hypothetical protein